MTPFSPTASAPPGRRPTWEIATLYPDQGQWDEWDYLLLNTNHLVEFADGYVEVPPMPTQPHQQIVIFLLQMLTAFTAPRRLGAVLCAPIPMRLREKKYREPDLLFMLAEHADRRTKHFWIGADLVMEVVSESEPDRDRFTKRQEYAEARIPEYWIVDPQAGRIIVLSLSGDTYAVHGEFAPGQQATSVLLKGFAVDVTAVFAAAE